VTILTQTRPATIARPIRDREFARRLESACDGHAHCPAMHHGRLTWIARELKSRYDEDLSVESVRKWFAGESRPRPEKTGFIAELLQVDVAWLQIGVDQGLAPRDRKIRNATANGAVTMVAGFIQMDGGFPAFPDETDARAQADSIDIYAIIRGVKYDFHVAQTDATGAFVVPTRHENVIVLGVVRAGFTIEVYEITPQQVEQFGHRRGGSIDVNVPPKMLRRIENFAARL
jgi:hypothetical protein